MQRGRRSKTRRPRERRACAYLESGASPDRRVDEAERTSPGRPRALPAASAAAHELLVGGSRCDASAKTARAALARAECAARQAGIPALMAEIESASLS